MINDFPKEIREKINEFIDKHNKGLNIEEDYDFSKSAISQGFTPEYVEFEIESLRAEYTQLQKTISPYLASKLDPYCFEMNLQDCVAIALAGLVRLTNVIILENPEQKVKLVEVQKKYADLIESEKYRVNYRSHYRRIFNDIDTKGFLLKWEDVFEKTCSKIDRIAGDYKLLQKFDSVYKLTEDNKGDLRLDELVPCKLDKLILQDRQKYLKKACKPELFLDVKNLKDFSNIDEDLYYFLNYEFKFSEEDFWSNAIEKANIVLKEDNIIKCSPRLIRMALEIKYGGDA